MNIRDLQYLVAVHDCGSFSQAAKKCFVSQPTLSGQLKKLEDELNVTLIERSTRKLLFTQIGAQVVEQAREVLQQVESIRVTAKESAEPMKGEFHLGLIPTVGPYLLPEIIPRITESYPQTELFLYELQTEKLFELLFQGALDAVILARVDWSHSLKEWPLYREELCLAIHEDDPWSKAERIPSLKALKDQSFLMLEDGHCLRDQALGYCFAAGAHEDKRFQATSVDTLLHMVACGQGMTLVPRLATNKIVEKVNYRRFHNPVPHRDIIMVGRLNSARETSLFMLAELICLAMSDEN